MTFPFEAPFEQVQADLGVVGLGGRGKLGQVGVVVVGVAFDQGLRLTYAFNHGEALRAYRKARTLDPNCAMCYWGEALVLGPNINLPMQEDAVAPAYEAARRAQA